MTRTAPYRHSDGSPCWTKNCSRKNTATVEASNKQKFIKEMLEAQKTHTPTGDEATLISSIATQEEFDAAVARQEITRQRHPEYPYSIYKYSQITTYSKNWNPITMASRGLIVDDETGEILARPFGKFFNYSEGNTPAELMTGPITVAEKLDGSLGITYMTPDGLQISTAGGFQSPQAAHATALYREKYEGQWKPRKGVTYLYEIIYPENRIVIDYGDEDDIHLLGAVNIKTGKSIPLSELKEWKWKRANEHENLSSLEHVINAPERSNAEGYIVHFLNTDTRVKFKHEEYVRHHRFATGINTRRIWEMLRDSTADDMNSWKQNAPEEFEAYINTTVGSLQGEFQKRHSEIVSQYESLKTSLPADISQKDFAQVVNTQVPREYRGFMFSLRNRGSLDERSQKSIWDMFKPEHENSMWSMSNGQEDDS